MVSISIRVQHARETMLLLIINWPFFILERHYASGQTWASICCSSGYESLVYKRAQDALCV